jgi:hypothetical protein
MPDIPPHAGQEGSEEPWWCDCPDREGPHVHMPNWGAKGSAVLLTALVDTGTGMEIPGSRSNEVPDACPEPEDGTDDR